MQQVGEISELSSCPCRGRRRDGDGQEEEVEESTGMQTALMVV